MSIAEKIFEEVKLLPESEAREVLDFVGYLKTKRSTPKVWQREQALSTLTKYRGRFRAMKFDRAELYNRG